MSFSSPPPKRRRISTGAADMETAIQSPGTIKINVSGAYIIDRSGSDSNSPHPSTSSSSSANSPYLDGNGNGISTSTSTSACGGDVDYMSAHSSSQDYEHDRRDIRLPNHSSVVSHVAADIGGSLAKVVYFSREPGMREGGRLHFLRFETDRIDACIEFIAGLQAQQRKEGGDDRMRRRERERGKSGKGEGGEGGKGKEKDKEMDNSAPELVVMATGGGAFKYYDRIRERLGVDVIREDEMECLIQGLDFFITEIPREVFTYNEQDVDNPMRFIDSQQEVYPYLLVNIGSGVSMIKVSGPDKFQRIGGTSLGGGTLWGLLSLLTGARTFDEMLAMADAGDNSTVDLLVGDIYGTGMGYEKIGLSEKTIASSFGKVFKRKREAERDAEDGNCEPDYHPPSYTTAATASTDNTDSATNPGPSPAPAPPTGTAAATTTPPSPAASPPPLSQPLPRPTTPPRRSGRMFAPADISRSLLYAVSNNIGQIAYLQSEKHDLRRIYFGGSFIRGHRQTINTLSFAINFWSKGQKQALFLRHEGYLGAVGAFLKRGVGGVGRWRRRGSEGGGGK
ncbi:hypothetical protein M8818_007906 [Zalaria obscura]|uniref:Uncharacterized protein n=1 Tax=Zalaria obscura TaxID=2024903 RepID=A0ACC3S2V4_9PEZI